MIKYECDICSKVETDEKKIAFITGKSDVGKYDAELCIDCFGKTFNKIQVTRERAEIKDENTGEVEIYSKAVQKEQAGV